MPNLPLWLVGRDVTGTTLTPQTVAPTTGVLTDTTPVATLFGHVDSVAIRSRKTTEEISPMDTVRENMVPIKVGTSIEVSEILKKSGTNLLATAYYGSADYFKVALTRGGQVFTFYGLFSSYEESLNRGKSTGTAVFDMVDPAAANPTYT